MPIVALLPYLPTFIKAGESLWEFVSKLRTAAQQSGEWDATHEQQFQDYLTALGKSSAWQPDLM